jgi:putative Holliday junction resolvase
MNQMSILDLKTIALDYGTRRIGVAVQAGLLAEPLEVISNQAGVEAVSGVVTEAALERIKTLCQAHRATQILVGVSEGEMAEMTQKFITAVKAKCQLPIVSWDETLSSVTVASRLKEAQVAQHRPHGPIDHFAAAIILEDWLDSQ